MAKIDRHAHVIVLKEPKAPKYKKRGGGPAQPTPMAAGQATGASPSVRRRAWERHSNLAAVFDELAEVLLVGGDDLSDRVHDDDLLPVPRWLCRALQQVLIDAITLSPEVLAGRKGAHKWWIAKHTAQLRHRHRYMLVRQLVQAGEASFTDDAVYEEVSNRLVGTFAAGRKDAIKKSYVKVASAVERDDPEFYVSGRFHIYEYLTRTASVTISAPRELLVKAPGDVQEVIFDYEPLFALAKAARKQSADKP